MAMQKDKRESFSYPFGITVTPFGFCIKVNRKCEKLFINIYTRNAEARTAQIEFSRSERVGDVWFLEVKRQVKRVYEYTLEDENGEFPDEYGRCFSGRDSFGKNSPADSLRRTPMIIEDFDWGDDCTYMSETVKPDIGQALVYRLHVRGFTKSASSKVVSKGTFKGLTDKVDYLKGLGVNAVDIMPATEFDELMRISGGWTSLFDKEKKERLRVNYWGYTNSLNFAPKASFASVKNRNPVCEYKEMVRTMHEAGIAVIQEFFFSHKDSFSYVLDVLRFWRAEYHLDGFHITGIDYNEQMVCDPYLSDCKFIFSSRADSGNKNVISMNFDYMNNMRRYLKGDEGMVPFVTGAVSDNKGALNFIADINGFSLADVYRYDYKHNDDNGEDGQDGTNMNFSWNCGFEGETRRLKVLQLRKRMYLNAVLLLMLSKGAILINSGDEVLQSKRGNNNSYCQDNDISWFDWKLVHKNRDFLNFFKSMLALRGRYLMEDAGRKPVISIHGMQVWKPDFEYYNRQAGILVEGEEELYIILNMHWEMHEFFLPTTRKRSLWYKKVDTNRINLPYIEDGLEEKLENQRKLGVAGRSCVILVARQR